MFPDANEVLCMLLPWPYHLGFVLMYGALLLKTWRFVLAISFMYCDFRFHQTCSIILFNIVWIITCLILSFTFSCIFFNRISIIFRKGQFKKVHLPDRTLLRHMAMIMAVAFGYLVAWTAANNDFSQMKKTSSGLKFVMCTENWWSYSAYGSKYMI